PIEPDEVAGGAAHFRVITASEIADLEALDLYHTGAQVRQLSSREWRRDSLLERHHRQSFQRQHVGLHDSSNRSLFPVPVRVPLTLRVTKFLSGLAVTAYKRTVPVRPGERFKCERSYKM